MTLPVVKVVITRKDSPKTLAYTYTGLTPDVNLVLEEIEYSDDSPVGPVMSANLEFHERWTMFHPRLMSVVSWYVRTYFSESERLDIQISID